MKRLLPACLFVLMCLLAGNPVWADTEPGNNDPSTTTDILVINGAAQSGSVTNSTDPTDYFKLVTTADGNITLTISTGNGNLVYFYLYDSDGTTQFNYNYLYGGTNSLTINGLAAGTYYARVTSGAGDNTYTLSATQPALTYNNDPEPNDGFATAVAMPLNGSAQGHISYRKNGGTSDQEDWYKVNVNGDGNLQVNITTENGNLVYFSLYDGDGSTQLQLNYLYGGSNSFIRNGLSAGTYYIRINGDPSTFNSYNVSNTLIPAAYSNDAEPNNVFSQAIPVNLGDTAKGHIGYRYNGATYDTDDWFKVTTTQAGNLFVNVATVNGNLVYFSLYDGDGTTQLRSSYLYGGNGNFTVNGLDAGNYYIRIQYGGNDQYNSYAVVSTLTPPAFANDSEPNDVFANANTIAENGSVTGQIGYRKNGGAYDTDDWYKLVTTKDGNIGLNIAVENGNLVYFSLYDNDGTTLFNTAYLYGGTNSFSQNGLAAGTYYVRIAHGGNGSNNSYQLSNTVTPALYANDAEPNNSIATAYRLNNRPTRTGHIGYRFNGNSYETDDYYKITMYSAGNCSFTLNQENGNLVYFYLYDAAQNQVYYNYSYGGNINFNFTSLAAGDYYFRLSHGGAGSYNSYAITNFNVPCNPAAAVIAPGGNTSFCLPGSVILNVQDAGEYASFLWSNNTTASAVSANVSGTYSVQATDWDGCVHASNSIVVNAQTQPIPVVTAGGATTFCQGGSVTLTASQANAYQWSNGATTQSIVVTATGNYSVTTQGATGCSATSAITAVTVNPLPATPTINTSGATTFCQGGSVTLTASQASSYLWSNGATTQSITINTSGSYSVTVQNANGCSATSAATTVTVNPLPATPTITAGGATTFCQGGSVTLTASQGASYLWSNGAATQSITINTSGSYSVTVQNANGCSATSAATTVTTNALPTVTLNSLAAVCVTDASFALSGGSPAGGTYSGTGVSNGQFNPAAAGVGSFAITYTYTNANNCRASDSKTIVVTQCNQSCTATATATGATTFCAGGNVTLTASPGSSYLWSNGATTQSITVSAGGTYSVTVTNATGCIATSNSISVTVNPLPSAVITASGTTAFCQGGTVTLTASQAASYLWSNGATTQSITVNTSGSYSVTVQNANGCSATSAATSVTVNPLPATPTITAGGATAFCQGGNVTLTASQASSYQWNNGAATQSINVNTSGSYSVTVQNANGCSATSAATTVTVNPLPVVTLGNLTAVCVTDAAFALSGGIPAGGTYSGTGVSNGQFNPAAAGVGSYVITYSYTNANNCTASDSKTIVVNQCTQTCTATATATGSTTFCQGGSVTLTASPGTSYLWSNGATTQSITVSAGGTYSVAVTNTAGCVATSNSITVTVNPLPATPGISTSGPATFCQGGSVTLTASSGTSYLWSNGATTQSITVNSSGSYSVTVKNANGCEATSAATAVSVNPLPTASISGNTNLCSGTATTLTASGGGTYLWSNGATTAAITVSPTTNTTYTVTVTNANGCSRSVSVTVTVSNCGGTYCTASGSNKSKGYINRVVFRSINNTSGWNNGYGNFLHKSTTVNRNNCYAVSVSPGYENNCKKARLYTRIWIDWNQDGDFYDAGELVFAPSTASDITRTGSIAVPCNAKPGATRMRVIQRADCAPSPCGSFAYGEVEDYTIVVGSISGKDIDAIDEIKENNQLEWKYSIYPNPVADQLVIQQTGTDNSVVVDARAQLQLQDASGRIVKQWQQAKSLETVSVSNLPNGYYTLRIRQAEQVQSFRIVVMH